MNAATRRKAVLLIVENAYVHQAAEAEILDADIVENKIADKVLIAAVYGETPLIVELPLLMVENVDISVSYILDSVRLFDIAVYAYHDGVCHIGPQRGIFHKNVLAAAFETHTGGIYGGTVVAVAAEHAVVAHIAACKGIHTVTPAVGADGLDVCHSHRIALPYRQLGDNDTLCLDFLGTLHIHACATTRRMNLATTIDAHIALAVDYESAQHPRAAVDIHHATRSHPQGVAGKAVHTRSEVNELRAFATRALYFLGRRTAGIERVGK